MRRIAIVAFALAASCANPGNQIELHGALRSLDGGDWSPVEEQGTLGLAFVHEAPGSVVGVEAQAFVSERTEDDFSASPTTVVDARGRTRELCFGLHKSLPVQYEGVHPYLGGGFSLLRAELRGASGTEEVEEDDDSAGLYLHGGVEFDFTPNLFLGLDLRGRAGQKVELLDDDLNAYYGQVAIVLGVRL
jgi:opacity protein-like surface antigen